MFFKKGIKVGDSSLSPPNAVPIIMRGDFQKILALSSIFLAKGDEPLEDYEKEKTRLPLPNCFKKVFGGSALPARRRPRMEI